MIILLNLVIISTMLAFGYRWTRQSVIAGFYWPSVMIKLAMGVSLGLLYRFYYTDGDTFALFEAAVVFKDLALGSMNNFIDMVILSDYQAYPGFQYSWIPTAFFIKILAGLALLTDNNYWLSGVYLSLFSFSGLWLWTNVLVRLLGKRSLALIAGFFFPSILFWSSGVMKEAIALPVLAVLLSFVVKYFLGDRINHWQIILVAVLFIILAITKYFVAAIFLAVVVALLLARRLNMGSQWFFEVLTLCGILLVIGFMVSLLHPNLWPSRIAEVIFNNYQAYLLSSDPQSVVVYQNLRPDMLSILIYLPKAVFAGLYLPLLPLEGSLVSFASVLENWLLLLATVAMFFDMIMPADRDRRLLAWGALLFVIISAGLIALSTPNLGTLARYKTSYVIVYIPFVMSGIFRVYRKFLSKG